jgi:hypothetical protein
VKTRGIENRERVIALKVEGKSVKEIMDVTGLKKPTVYAYLRPVAAKPVKAVKSAKTAKKVVAKRGNGHEVRVVNVGLHVTPMANGMFLVTVPAERLAKVAQALA